MTSLLHHRILQYSLSTTVGYIQTTTYSIQSNTTGSIEIANCVDLVSLRIKDGETIAVYKVYSVKVETKSSEGIA